LDLGQSVRPLNDEFANRLTLTGSGGTAAGTSVNATKEGGEPNIAGNAGGASVWWRWTAPAAGQVSLNTHGSGFNTLLAAYTGSDLSALSLVAANNDDGSAGGTSGVLFEAQPAQEYVIAVDGQGGASGSITINWSLNTGAAADLTLQLSGPASTSAGAPATYIATVQNSGPQTATDVRVSEALPSGLQFQSASPSCAFSSGSVVCSIASLAAGAMTTVQWSAIASQAGAFQSTASVSSDVPDPVTTNNSATVTTSITSNGDADAPLPVWSTLLLASLLLVSALRRLKGRTLDR